MEETSVYVAAGTLVGKFLLLVIYYCHPKLFDSLDLG